jgi:hypothetical protein
MNLQRAGWAEECLDTFRDLTGAEKEDAQDLGDLLANLLHAARKRGLDPLKELEDAKDMFLVEEADDE